MSKIKKLIVEDGLVIVPKEITRIDEVHLIGSAVLKFEHDTMVDKTTGRVYLKKIDIGVLDLTKITPILETK